MAQDQPHAHPHDHSDGDVAAAHVGKGHDDVRQGLGLDSATGRISYQIIATLLGGVLLICSLIAHPWLGLFENEFYYTALAFVSAVLLGAPLVWVAFKDLLTGHTHMNELVALAVLAAFATEQYQEAAAIAFFMIISVLIENRTALGAQASIESLIRITPTRAARLAKRVADEIKQQAARGEVAIETPRETGALADTMADESQAAPDVDQTDETDEQAAAHGDEDEVDARDLRPGDVVRVRPGDNIPADGVILRGLSTVNQATITGESLPADKSPGDEVFGGTINLTGVMEIEVTKAGEDTTLGKVKNLILQAESTRIPIMRMIDRYAGWYTPTILMLVAITLFIAYRSDWDNPMQRAISMLVIACPCAMILATPTAMVAALSAAARLGVLIKSVVDLEAARNLTSIVFDKTGTLTTGELEVTRLAPAPGVEAVELLSVAGAVERNSRHPVARAVVGVAHKARVKLAASEDFHEAPGRGVSATIDGQPVLVGRGEWVIEQDDRFDAANKQYVRNALGSAEAEGLSLLFVTKGDRVLGWVGLADNTRPEAAGAMDTLRAQGLRRLIMVTGDRESVAKRVAGQMHTEYRAEVLPHEKLELVDELKEAGHKVAVIGDGVNDAPALAAGDISIAMGAAGSDVAIHSAKIALMNNNLNRIPFLVDLSRRSSRIIKQNLIFALAFIILFLVLAAAGLIPEIVAAILHVVSGLIVVFNSARLVRAGEDLEHAEEAGDRPERSTPRAAGPGGPPTAEGAVLPA